MQLDLLETSFPVMDTEITVPVGDIPMAGHGALITAESADPRNWDASMSVMHVNPDSVVA